MSRIRVLPDAVASRIAAGEVVERPASVVKELVENALDAGARRIEVALEQGGRALIRVSDDGCGMDRDDALLAFEQHATSKVDPDEAHFGARTRGFRGEALPAIAAVSRVTLVSAERDGDGTRVRVDRGRLKDVASAGAPRGTEVEVRDLFADLPARRKFLRSRATEMSHVVRYLEQQALAEPDVHFRLTEDGREVLDLPAAPELGARVRQVLGQADVVPVEGSRGTLRVQAWLSPAPAARGAGLTMLVNGRPVVDRTLAHAVREAVARAFATDGSPEGVVMLRLDPGDVDVNVHPAKREVRFARPGEVHDAVRDLLVAGIAARGSFAPMPHGAFAPMSHGAFAPMSHGAFAPMPHGAFAPMSHGAFAPMARGRLPAANTDAAAAPVPSEAPVQGALIERVGEPEAGFSGACEPRQERMPEGRRVLGQHRNTYILAEDEQGLLLIDQHCAHERVLYEQFLAGLGAAGARQALLEPVVVELPRARALVVAERLEDLARLGLEAERFGDASFVVRSVPAVVGSQSPADLLAEIAAHDEAGGTLDRVHRLAATMACKAAVKAGFPLGHERMRWLLDALLSADVPTTCPHGRIALRRLGARDLDHQFQRI